MISISLPRWLAPLCILPLFMTACNQTPVHNPGAQTSSETAAANISDQVRQNITTKLQNIFTDKANNPNLKILSIRKTPLDNLYEVVLSGNQIVYTDAKGDYMFLGYLVNLNTRENLTEQRTKELTKVDFNQLSFDKAIKEIRGNGQRKLAVFSDPDCPFCKKLEQEIGALDNVTVYTFLMPLTELHPNAREKADQIWCQSDRAAAWAAWMRQDVVPSTVPQCETPVGDNIAFGKQHGFDGTPTLIFPNGETVSGLMLADELNQALDSKQK